MDWDIVAVVAAGLSVFLAVLALLWPRKPTAGQVYDRGVISPKAASEIVQAVHRRGRHLRTD